MGWVVSKVACGRSKPSRRMTSLNVASTATAAGGGPRVEDPRLRNASEVVRRGRAPPGGHVDPDQAAEVIMKLDPALTCHVEARLERATDHVPEPGCSGLVRECAEAIEPL